YAGQGFYPDPSAPPMPAPPMHSYDFNHQQQQNQHRNHDEVHTWVGHWTQDNERGDMLCEVRISPLGVITGSGSDVVGPFKWQGTINYRGEVELSKQYNSHTVTYRGMKSGSEIRGTWTLEKDHGHFYIQDVNVQ
ncbi:hypothetical protein AKO1_000477, partial [Acrasis kona]